MTTRADGSAPDQVIIASRGDDMPYYRVTGEIPRKRHVRFKRPDGGLYAEELMGEEGFSSDSSLLYHVHPPTAIVKSETMDEADVALAPNHPLLPRHYRTQDLSSVRSGSADPVLGRLLLMGNDDVRISFVSASGPSDLYRNSTGDEAVYVHEGAARFESVYGTIDAVAGDYVIVPRGTIHRWVPVGQAGPGRAGSAAGLVSALVIEAHGHIGPPKRYLSQAGQFLEHAPYCERDLRPVAGPLIAEGAEVPVIVRSRYGLTRLTYAHHPFDVVGWDGFLYPYAFNIADFEPIVKRTHAPPPVHQTFEGPNFVICSFCPRPLDFDPQSVPIPYNHHNVDSDEMMFYVAGDYSARQGSGVGIGSITLHPSGFTHGPTPGAVEAVIAGVDAGHRTTDETAVMIDTFRPLLLAPRASLAEDPEYAWSWARAEQS